MIRDGARIDHGVDRLAVRTTEAAGIVLIAVVRSDGFKIFPIP
jgi:hypothetical protein